MVIGRVPPPLPPRRQTTIPASLQTTVSSSDRFTVVANPIISRRCVSSSLNIGQTDSARADPLPNKTGTDAPTPVLFTASATSAQTTVPQDGPVLPSLLLSLVLKEPIERSHGRISTITAVQSLFASNVPAPPPFDYSTLIDHALLAGQIALHDPQTRLQKRLPLVLTLSIGAFLVAATGIIPRYFGWMMLAGATWFGPGRFLMKELWYISAVSLALALLVDIFPMLTLGTLLWVGVIAASRVMEGGNKPVMGKQNTVQLAHSTAAAFQSGKDIKPVALDIVQNVTEWWAFRQSEPEKQRRLEKKAAKEEAKILKLREVQAQKDMKKAELARQEAEKLRKIEEEKELKRTQQEKAANDESEVHKLQNAESEKELKLPLLGHQEAERLRRAEEQKELKRKQLEEKEAEKERKKEFERVETERLKAEKQRQLEEETRLKEAKSEEKYRLRQRENELKRLKAEEKVTKKRRELEEKERRKREKLEEGKQSKKPVHEFKPELPGSSGMADKVTVDFDESTLQPIAVNVDNLGTAIGDSTLALPSPPISEGEMPHRLEVIDSDH